MRSQHTRSRWLGALGAGVLLALAGCVDPEGRYDAFLERTQEARSRDAGPVAPTDRIDWSGRYLLALSTVLAPDSPLLFAVEVEVSSDLESAALTLQPLTTDDDDDPRTPIGDSIDVTDVAYSEDGTFSADLGSVRVPGRANPITGSDIVADVQLTASTRDAADDRPIVFCGEVTGMVTSPISLDLTGSTFGGLLTDDVQETDPLLRCPR